MGHAPSPKFLPANQSMHRITPGESGRTTGKTTAQSVARHALHRLGREYKLEYSRTKPARKHAIVLRTLRFLHTMRYN
jgi:hypothetical protein